MSPWGSRSASGPSCIAATLGITYWAAKRTRTAREFYAAGRGITGFQNGLALAGGYMSAASFLGIAGLVSLKGYDGLIYSAGFLVGWPVVLCLIAEPLRNLGKFTFSDVTAYRLDIILSPSVWVDIFKHAAPIVPFKNPGLFSMAGAFFAGIAVSLAKAEPPAAAKFEERKVRSYLGVGAE